MEEEIKIERKKTLYSRIRRKFRHTVVAFFIDAYRTLRAQPFFVNAINRESKDLYKKTAKVFTPIQKKVVEAMNRDGIFITSLAELGLEENLKPLQDFTQKEFEAAEIGRSKKFLFYLWNNAPIIDLKNPVVKFGLSPTLIEIGNVYLELLGRFVFYSVNKTVIVKDAEAQGSQHWHRDPPLGDEKIFKFFLYLNDVKEDSGPFMYIKGSQRAGRFGKIFGTK